MTFIEELMSLQELIESINIMLRHDEDEFFRQNLHLIARELHTKFRVLDDEADNQNQNGDWMELNE